MTNKKIIAAYNSAGKVEKVYSFDQCMTSGKTEEDVIARVEILNEKSANGSYLAIFEVPDSLLDTITFLLGEAEYKTAHTIWDIIAKIDDLSYDLNKISNELEDYSELFRVIKNSVDNINDDIENNMHEFLKTAEYEKQ